MEFEQVLELIRAVSESELIGFQYESDGVRIQLKKEKEKVPSAAVLTAVQPVSAPEKTAKIPETEEKNSSLPTEEGHVVTSPLVGMFYAAPEEGGAPFVKVGDSVKKGQTLAIVEAMKLMNEIESDYDGTVTEVFVENGQAVEYGQPLFSIA